MATRAYRRLVAVATPSLARATLDHGAGSVRFYSSLRGNVVNTASTIVSALRRTAIGGVRAYHQSELEEEFEEKVAELSVMDRTNLSVTMHAQLNAYYNQAVRGQCFDSPRDAKNQLRAMMLEIWRSLGEMEKDVAMANFVVLMKEIQGDEIQVDEMEKKDMAMFEEEQMAVAFYGTEDIIVSVKDHVQTIRLNRPARRNALTLDMFVKVPDLLADAAADDDIYVTVLTGAGEYFCSGNDLDNFNLANTTMDDIAVMAHDTLLRFVATFIDHPKPIIAAVNGPAVGIATTILGLCDTVLASTEATFHTPFTSLGQSPEGCSSYLFPRIMGPAKANDVLLLGRKLTAAEALEHKLVSRTVNAEVFERDCTAIANWMVSLPQESLRSTRNLIRSYDIEKLHEVNRMECELLVKRWKSQECLQALLAFSKRNERKIRRRLQKVEGHDHRLVGEHEERLKEEMREHLETQQHLSDRFSEYPELEDGSDDTHDVLPAGDNEQAAGHIPAGDEQESTSTHAPPPAKGPSWRD